MRIGIGLFTFLLAAVGLIRMGVAQTFPAPDFFKGIVRAPVSPAEVPGPKALKDFVVSGELKITLADSVRLMLLNNTGVRMDQLDLETAQFSIQRAYQPFDPVGRASFNATRSQTPTSVKTEGAETRSDLNQQTQFGYSQTFQTGTRFDSSFNASKSSTNNVFSFYNPSIFSRLNFSLTQPLLRDRGFFPNQAPIVIARRNLNQSQANFEAQINDSISRVINQYWAVVGARENLKVQKTALDMAELTYKRNLRELELGALPPLNIFRSESQVASRRVDVIRAEYTQKQAEDALRQTIGADLDGDVRNLKLNLVEAVEASGALMNVNLEEALQQALSKRPEVEGLRQQLTVSDINVRLAHTNLKPDLDFSTFYSGSGQSGNRYDTSMDPPVLVDQGGLGDTITQIGRFDYPTYGFSFQLNLPIKNRAAQADLGNALVNKRRSLYSMRQLEQSINLEVRNAANQLEQTKLSMTAAKVARDLAQKTLEAEQRKYELGATQIFFVLDAQTQLAQAEVSYLQSQISYHRAVTDLDRATGRLLESHRVQIEEAKQ
jgi:HAE1 family hydrophobic/amphiphilic exporter-1